MKGSSPFKARPERWLLFGIMGLALWIRLWGLSWGLPYPYHPDEGSILFHALAFGTGDLNPHWFRWPSFQMYVMFFIYGFYYVIGRFLDIFHGPMDILVQYITDPTPLWYLGRLFSALMGVATVYLVYRIGKRMFGSPTGLLAALILGTLYLHVRDSHYATPDVFLAFLMLLSFWYSVCILDRPTWKNYILAGLFAGLAVSTKYLGGALVCIPIFFSHMTHFASKGVFKGWRSHRLLIGAAGLALFGFFLGTPYSLLAFHEFLDHFLVQTAMVNPLEAEQTSFLANYLSGLELILFRILPNGMGSLLFGSLIVGALFSVKKAGKKDLLILSYWLPYLVVFSLLQVKRATYFTPLLPIFAMMIACLILSFSEYIRGKFSQSNAFSFAVVGVITLILVFPSFQKVLAFNRVLGRTDTRTAAKDWIEKHIPQDAIVLKDQYAPVLNQKKLQLKAGIEVDTTEIASWKSHKSRYKILQYELLKDKRPQYEIIDLPVAKSRSPYDLIDEALSGNPGIDYLVLSSKFLGCPKDIVKCLGQSLEKRGLDFEEVKVFEASVHEPVLDNPNSLTFHNPTIAILKIRKTQEDRLPARGS